MHKNAESKCDESEEKLSNGNDQVVHLAVGHEMEVCGKVSDEEEFLILEEISLKQLEYESWEERRYSHTLWILKARLVIIPWILMVMMNIC
jgi:hypothetical protein